MDFYESDTKILFFMTTRYIKKYILLLCNVINLNIEYNVLKYCNMFRSHNQSYWWACEKKLDQALFCQVIALCAIFL